MEKGRLFVRLRRGENLGVVNWVLIGGCLSK